MFADHPASHISDVVDLDDELVRWPDEFEAVPRHRAMKILDLFFIANNGGGRGAIKIYLNDLASLQSVAAFSVHGHAEHREIGGMHFDGLCSAKKASAGDQELEIKVGRESARGTTFHSGCIGPSGQALSSIDRFDPVVFATELFAPSPLHCEEARKLRGRPWDV